MEAQRDFKELLESFNARRVEYVIVGAYVAADYGGTPVYFLGRVELVANKRASGRVRDLADLEALGES